MRRIGRGVGFLVRFCDGMLLGQIFLESQMWHVQLLVLWIQMEGVGLEEYFVEYRIWMSLIRGVTKPGWDELLEMLCYLEM